MIIQSSVATARLITGESQQIGYEEPVTLTVSDCTDCINRVMVLNILSACSDVVWVLIILFILVFFAYNQLVDRAMQLPGPWGLPIVGYLPFLGGKMNLTIDRLAKRYGNVFQLQLGSRNIVVISGQEMIRKALLNKPTVFAGRPDFYTYKTVKSFIFDDFSPAYRVYKKLTLKAFGQFAKVHKKELQQVAHNAVQMLMKEFRIANNQPIDLNPVLCKATCTIIGYICYGEYFDVESEDVTKLLESPIKFSKLMAYGVICDFLPWMKFLVKKQLQELEELLENFSKHFDNISAVRIDSYNGKTMRDVSDVFRKLTEGMNEDEKKLLKIDDNMLKCHIFTTFGAGFDTATHTMSYAMMIMALNPEIQKRVQEEIDNVIGRDRFPEFDDESVLPYTVATITEILRHHSLAALAITHSTTCDTEFGGYFIPKQTPVIFNLQSANYDEKVFTDPERFDPSRFLTNAGTLDSSLAKCIVPYGLGFRRCAGEPVAHLEVFLLFAIILQQCTIEQAPGHPLNLDNYIMGLAKQYTSVKVIVRLRNKKNDEP